MRSESRHPALCGPVFPIRFGGIDSLDAVRALFHDAAAAYRNIGVVKQSQARSFIVREQIEIESADLVRTVVGTVAGPHAAVIDHVVEAFGAVAGSLNGAN